MKFCLSRDNLQEVSYQGTVGDVNEVIQVIHVDSETVATNPGEKAREAASGSEDTRCFLLIRVQHHDTCCALVEAVSDLGEGPGIEGTSGSEDTTCFLLVRVQHHYTCCALVEAVSDPGEGPAMKGEMAPNLSRIECTAIRPPNSGLIPIRFL